MPTKRGAGRPPKDGQKRERIDVRLPREMVAWLKRNGATAQIEEAIKERMDKMAHDLSVNNGRTTCTPEEAIADVGFDTLVNAMDDEIREQIHNEGDYTPEEFIAQYIKHAPLIVG